MAKRKLSKQCLRLLHHLRQAGSPVTPLDSWKVLGIYRLGARIFDLRAAGYDIRKETITVYNSWGEKARVAGYTLVGEPDHG